MKTHQSRPVIDELQEMHAIASREHGPHGHSTRLINRALVDARRALQQPAAAAAAQAVVGDLRSSKRDWPQEGPAR